MIEGVSELPKGAGAKALASCLAALYRPASGLSALAVHEGVPHRAPDTLVAHVNAQRPANRRQFAGRESNAQFVRPFDYRDQRQPSGRRARFHFQYRHRMFSAFRYANRRAEVNVVEGCFRGCPGARVCACLSDLSPVRWDLYAPRDLRHLVLNCLFETLGDWRQKVLSGLFIGL